MLVAAFLPAAQAWAGKLIIDAVLHAIDQSMQAAPGLAYVAPYLALELGLILLGSLANPLLHGESISYSKMMPGLDVLFMFLTFFSVAGLGQGLGWTGFLTPRLQARCTEPGPRTAVD